MKKRFRGALTLEAAISLPIYIFAILTLSYIIQVYYVHNAVDAAAGNALQSVATKTFYLDLFGVIEAGDAIAERTKDTKEKLEATIEKSEKVYSNVEDITNDVMAFDTQSLGLKDIMENIKEGKIKTVIKNLKALRKNIKAQIEEPYNKSKETIQDVKDIFSTSKELMDDPKGLGITVVSEGLSRGIQYLVSRYILFEVRRELGPNADSYRIRNIKINMGDHGLLYTDQDSGLNRLLTVDLEYTIAIPLFIAPEVKLDQKVHKTVRAWIGEKESAKTKEGE